MSSETKINTCEIFRYIKLNSSAPYRRSRNILSLSLTTLNYLQITLITYFFWKRRSSSLLKYKPSYHRVTKLHDLHISYTLFPGSRAKKVTSRIACKGVASSGMFPAAATKSCYSQRGIN